MRILVTGASGSGTSTLGRAVAEALQAAFVEVDDLYWLPTDPPFKQKRDPVERAALLRGKLGGSQPVVVSGSIVAWDRELEDAFDLIVFLRAPAALRAERLRAREQRRFGRVDEHFIAWAEQYDQGIMSGRSLAKHLAWLNLRTCPILRLSGTDSVETLQTAVLTALLEQDRGRHTAEVDRTSQS